MEVFLAQVSTDNSYLTGQVTGGLVAYLVYAASMFVCAQKLREDAPFLALIPIVNGWYLTKLAQKSILWFILLLIPCVNIIAFAVLWGAVAERRGKAPLLGWLTAVPCIGLVTAFLIAAD